MPLNSAIAKFCLKKGWITQVFNSSKIFTHGLMYYMAAVALRNSMTNFP